MFDIIMYLIEAIIIGYTIFKLFKLSIIKVDLVIFVMSYFITAIVTSYFLAYNYIFSLLSTLFIYLLISSLEVNISNYNRFLISVLFEVIISFCSSLSLVRYINILWDIGIVYYILTFFSRIILLAILCYLCCKYLDYFKYLQQEYSILISCYLLISLFICYYVCNMMFINKLTKLSMLLILLGYFINVFLVGILIIYINRDIEKKRKQELEIEKLKFIEDKYIYLKAQKERNENIKHDLEYFITLTRKHREDKLTNLLEETIKKIDDQEIKIYSQNKIINNLLNKFKEISNNHNQTIHYNLNIINKDITILQYDQLLAFF